MKSYQYNLNNIAWLAIIAILLALVLSSCKKEKQLEPDQIITQSTIHYKCMSTFMWQYDEAIDIYVYGNGTMSTVIKNGTLKDTISYPIFHYTPKSTPLIIHGHVATSSNSDTLYLTYSNHNPWTNETNYVTKAKYLKQ